MIDVPRKKEFEKQYEYGIYDIERDIRGMGN